MLTNGKDFKDIQNFRSQVCIIGAGPAGISLALKLAELKIGTILLESGDLEVRSEANDLNKGLVANGSAHEPLETYRYRTVGGASSHWGGRCIPFDPVDFQEREHVADSGWPFPKKELDPYFREASKICEAGANLYTSTEALAHKQEEIFPGFDSAYLNSKGLERWSPPTHFGKKYREDLENSKEVELLYNLTCTHIQLDPDGAKVQFIEVKTSAGDKHFVQADIFILAAGCIENTRLLLSSWDVHPSGIGNMHDVVGRYYMAHISGITSKAKIHPRVLTSYIHNFEQDEEGIILRRRFALSEKAQQEHQLLNIIGFFFRPELADPTHQDAIFSLAHIKKQGVGKFLLKEPLGKKIAHIRNIAASFPGLMDEVKEIQRQRNEARRLPYLISSKQAPYQYFFYQSEQAPNPNSRISIDLRLRDALGMPRAVVDLRFSDLDFKTIKAFHKMMKERFEELQLGEFYYEESELEKHLDQKLRNFDSGSHHMGSTRMSTDPKKGVVNKEGQVHGVRNLYVNGASTFPTGSHANPTLTIVAMALRLADHLKSKCSEKLNLKYTSKAYFS
ncbi:MAG: GMC family oxidoreductase [Bacteroidota bacterium]